jgi:hypothetical protein
MGLLWENYGATMGLLWGKAVQTVYTGLSLIRSYAPCSSLRGTTQLPAVTHLAAPLQGALLLLLLQQIKALFFAKH